MTELVDKDAKISIINILHVFKRGEESITMMRKEMEEIIKTHIELLEGKIQIS